MHLRIARKDEKSVRAWREGTKCERKEERSNVATKVASIEDKPNRYLSIESPRVSKRARSSEAVKNWELSWPLENSSTPAFFKVWWICSSCEKDYNFCFENVYLKVALISARFLSIKPVVRTSTKDQSDFLMLLIYGICFQAWCSFAWNHDDWGQASEKCVEEQRTALLCTTLYSYSGRENAKSICAH